MNDRNSVKKEHRKNNIILKKKEGITLVALVVTIVVLLILVGITINLMLGPNSIFNNAQNARLETALGKIEEQARIIESDLMLKKHQGEIKEITVGDIIAQLKKQGYEIETREVGENTITEIAVEPKKVKITENGTVTVQVKFKEIEGGYRHYVKIEEKYYLMKFTGTSMTIERDEKKLDGTTVETTLEIENGYDTEIISNVAINENEITLMGGSKEGSTSITIKYGKCTATCEVKMAEKANNITAKEMAIIEDMNSKIEVSIEPKDAVVRLKYSTTDTEKIEIGEDGTVTAKSLGEKQRDTATVTITDEISRKTANCNITIDTLKGTFIEYDVEYTEVYNDYSYTKENGWRLLNYKKNTTDGTYSDVELISTGIPAYLYYHYGTNAAKSINGWWEEDAEKLNDFKAVLGGSNYIFYNNADEIYSNYPALRAACRNV